jgi:hypothetical protein
MINGRPSVRNPLRSGSITFATLALTLCSMAAASRPAYGTTLTVGPQLPLANPFEVPLACEVACTLTNSQAPYGRSYVAPIDGVVVRWRLFGANPASAGYRIRVLNHLGDGNLYVGRGSGPLQRPPSRGVETFPASLPIRAGQSVAINLESTSSFIGFEANESAPSLGWQPPLEDGRLRSAAEGEGFVLGFNADIQPRPTIAYLTSVKGSIEGGTEVTFFGADFSGATAVAFAAAPATSFVVDSDTQITAVSPPSAAPGPVAVSLTTPAGVATAQFRYLACVVPKLKGSSLKAAKSLSRHARCRIGRVTKLGDAKPRSAEVSSQKPKPGSVLKPGSRVRVTLRQRS